MELVNIQNKLLKANLKIFSGIEFRRLLNITGVSAKKLLESYTKKGIFIRLKRGLYSLRLNQPTANLIANKLYKPSYLSFETALSFYNLIPEAVYSFTSATPLKTKKWQVEGQLYSYHKISRNAFTGYKLTKIGEDKVLFAEKEKALADYLYFVFIRKKSLNDRLRTKGVNYKRLLAYTVLFGKPKFTKWVKNVI